MTTINKVLARANELRPNALDVGTKAAWVLGLEGQLVREVVMNADPAPQVDPPTEYPKDGDKPLTVESPYDRMYVLYLVAQIDLANEDMDEYNNALATFSTAFGDWARAYRRAHRPKSAGGFRMR